MIVLVLTAIGVASALYTTDRVRRIAELPIVGLWLVWLAIGTQVLVFQWLGHFIPVGVSNALHLATYALCMAFLVRNRQIPGLWIITVGTAMNLAAIVANGGSMPARPAAWRAAGLPDPDAFENSSAVAEARLAYLGDIFYVPEGWPLANVFSIGDVLIVLGGTYLAHRWCATPPAEPSRETVADHVRRTATPVPADIEAIAEIVAELRDQLDTQLALVSAQADTAHRQAAALREEARADVERTHGALSTLLAELDGKTLPRPVRAELDEERFASIERQLAANQRALDQCLARQDELADTVAATLDVVVAHSSQA
ncbi:MAG: DUF5317 domain-containing protein [Ilumatobacter sp.]|uniref:DUF5317 domain-containing protein n=1 Tax=Ilumatobacter sp. TaxID=1967498 RepID=UPI0026151F30|nr:DUF5317 domain-containing protein [Ilumatobacter sp.]MDJ0770997.1 DUF5317 domain-containing protein [Ilumatobacter sp.]